MIYKFFEYAGKFDPIKSFYLKEELNPDVWSKDKEINSEIREELLEIATDHFESLDLDVKLSDIIFTGSLANYNWSEYSDFDLHLVMDFKEINEDVDLVKKYLNAASKIWNQHHEIFIKDYEVEIYSQDINESHMSSGQYSILNDKWKVIPTHQNFVPDEDLIKLKSEMIISSIEYLEQDLENDVPYEELTDNLQKVWKKIKEGRKAGLEREGEFSIENLVFKLLRRNGYIKKILDVKRKAYDKKFN